MPVQRERLRRATVVAVLTPALLAVAVTMFAWPSARLQPRNLPVGIVAASAGPLDRVLGAGGAFEVHHYADEGAARAAIVDRDIYGAFAPATGRVTVYVASAASATVALQLETIAASVAAQTAGTAQTVDVVATSPEDPHGMVLGSAVLPLVFGGEIIAVVVALMLGVKPARRQLAALVTASAAAAGAAYAVAQGWLGALPHQPLATIGALALMLLAISTTAAGLFAVLGVRGLGVAAATMIFLGNPFSGVTSAPDLLPSPADWIGRLLPPGAGASLLRATAYFGGAGALEPVCVLLAWTAAGIAAIVAGHRRLQSGHHEHADLGRHAVPEPVG